MSVHNVEHDDFRNELEADLIYICTFGLEDPLRPNIDESIQLLRYGSLEAADGSEGSQVNIRMTTGDHLESALAIALKTGIIKHEEFQQSSNGIAMLGS
jgi:magnesium-transporting ATPase (P-type)